MVAEKWILLRDLHLAREFGDGCKIHQPKHDGVEQPRRDGSGIRLHQVSLLPNNET